MMAPRDGDGTLQRLLVNPSRFIWFVFKQNLIIIIIIITYLIILINILCFFQPLKNLLLKSNEGRGLLNLYSEQGKLSNNG